MGMRSKNKSRTATTLGVYQAICQRDSRTPKAIHKFNSLNISNLEVIYKKASNFLSQPKALPVLSIEQVIQQPN